MPVQDTNTSLLDQAVNDLTARLGQLDGIGLKDPTKAVIAELKARVEAIRTMTMQATLTLESQLGKLQATVNALQTQLNQALASQSSSS